MVTDICRFPLPLAGSGAEAPLADENRDRLTRVRAGDQDAARELVERLYPRVIGIIRSHLPRRSAEEDLAQEVFMKVFARLHQFQGAVPFSHWVSRIAVTTCIDRLRGELRRPELRRTDLSDAEAAAFDAATGDSAENPRDALAARELVSRLLQRLLPEDRLVIQLFDLEQKSTAEIARLMGLRANLVKTRVFRARRKLRRMIHTLDCQ